jgi:hypothetical protein
MLVDGLKPQVADDRSGMVTSAYRLRVRTT